MPYLLVLNVFDTHKTSLIPPLFIEVPFSRQEYDRSCICVFWVSNLPLFTFSVVSFETVPTVWYFSFSILLDYEVFITCFDLLNPIWAAIYFECFDSRHICRELSYRNDFNYIPIFLLWGTWWRLDNKLIYRTILYIYIFIDM